MKGTCVLSLALLISACAAGGNAGMKRTETEFGLGIYGNLSREIAPQTTIHGLASYNRFFFDGGHDNLFRLGVQARRQLSLGTGNWWLGGELTYVRDTSVYSGDVGFDNPTSNGYSIGGLAGYGLKFGTLEGSLYGGISLIHFGDFKANDFVIDSSGNSTFFRVGAEVMLPILGR